MSAQLLLDCLVLSCCLTIKLMLAMCVECFEMLCWNIDAPGPLHYGNTVVSHLADWQAASTFFCEFEFQILFKLTGFSEERFPQS